MKDVLVTLSQVLIGIAVAIGLEKLLRAVI